MKNNQGFTLVELIATIVVLALVLSITGYAISTVISSARTKNYELLINDIKSAAELYYQECTYMASSVSICGNENITLGNLVEYGYLASNDTTESNTTKVINPTTEDDISSCQIKIILENDKIKVTDVTKTGSCPTEY